MIRKERNCVTQNVNRLFNILRIQRNYFALPVAKTDFIICGIEKKIKKSMNWKKN